MNCTKCGIQIKNTEDIHWLDDIIVCYECFQNEQFKHGDVIK